MSDVDADDEAEENASQMSLEKELDEDGHHDFEVADFADMPTRYVDCQGNLHNSAEDRNAFDELFAGRVLS